MRSSILAGIGNPVHELAKLMGIVAVKLNEQWIQEMVREIDKEDKRE